MRMLRSLALLLLLITSQVQGADWPQWMGPNRDGVWPETDIVDILPKDGPKVLWRTKIAGGYAGPAVADGLVYVTDYVTTADTRKLSSPAGRPKIKGTERVLCLDAKTGKEVWKHTYDCPYAISYPLGPRCTPTVADGKVYTLGSEGHLFCFDAKKGAVLWKKHFGTDYGAKTPIWGFCGHPLVEGDMLVCLVGGKGALVVAFDKNTGKEMWKALDVPTEGPGYCSPSVITSKARGRTVNQLLIWDPEHIHSLVPETGLAHWKVALQPSYGMSIMAPQKLGNYLFAGGIGERSVMLEFKSDKLEPAEVWRGKRGVGVFPANATPLLEGDMIYGCDCGTGAFIGAEIKTGKRLWETWEPTVGKAPAKGGRVGHGTTFVVKNGERHLLFAETGHLITANLSAKGYQETSRAKILEPTGLAFGRDVLWSHPAFAMKCMFARNDKEIVCVSLAK